MDQNNMEDSFSLSSEFRLCESLIDELESGKRCTAEIQGELNECMSRLERLTKEVSIRGIFSPNESIEELPTSSMQYLLIPYFLATILQNLISVAKDRLELLNNAALYLRDFLERLFSYGIIGFSLPWLCDDADVSDNEPRKLNAAEIRSRKLNRFNQMKELETNLVLLNSERQCKKDDDYLLRELLMTRLRLFALKAINDLDSIEDEKPLVEHMIKLASNDAEPTPRKKSHPRRPPIIIARDDVQKKVFGLGYPSLPTVTVNEWYDELLKSGRAAPTIPSTVQVSPPLTPDEDTNAAADIETNRLRQWDEYKDDHRRGWGNMHNKG